MRATKGGSGSQVYRGFAGATSLRRGRVGSALESASTAVVRASRGRDTRRGGRWKSSATPTLATTEPHKPNANVGKGCGLTGVTLSDGGCIKFKLEIFAASSS